MKIFAALLTLLALSAHAQQPVTWRFDNLAGIGGAHATTVGAPTLVSTDIGKAIHFNGQPHSGDALFLDSAPLAGDTAYTFEVIFRPSSKGVPEQRFFHLQENGSESRRMFEIRIVDNHWCLDAVAIDMGGNKPQTHAVILNCDATHLHSLDTWFAVAATYDGATLRAYVDGELQGEAKAVLTPLSPGQTSVGTRIDKRDFFTGDVYSARFTPRVLPASEFLHSPAPSK